MSGASLPSYEHLDRGDVSVVRAYGVTHHELFENAALGVSALTWPVDAIPPRHARPLVAPGDTLEELLVNWIEETLHVGRRDGLALSYFVVDRLESGGVQGSASGLPIAEVHRLGAEVRCVTDPMPTIVTIPDGFWCDVNVERERPLRRV